MALEEEVGMGEAVDRGLVPWGQWDHPGRELDRGDAGEGQYHSTGL